MSRGMCAHMLSTFTNAHSGAVARRLLSWVPSLLGTHQRAPPALASQMIKAWTVLELTAGQVSGPSLILTQRLEGELLPWWAMRQGCALVDSMGAQAPTAWLLDMRSLRHTLLDMRSLRLGRPGPGESREAQLHILSWPTRNTHLSQQNPQDIELDYNVICLCQCTYKSRGWGGSLAESYTSREEWGLTSQFVHHSTSPSDNLGPCNMRIPLVCQEHVMDQESGCGAGDPRRWTIGKIEGWHGSDANAQKLEC